MLCLKYKGISRSKVRQGRLGHIRYFPSRIFLWYTCAKSQSFLDVLNWVREFVCVKSHVFPNWDLNASKTVHGRNECFQQFFFNVKYAGNIENVRMNKHQSPRCAVKSTCRSTSKAESKTLETFCVSWVSVAVTKRPRTSTWRRKGLFWLLVSVHRSLSSVASGLWWSRALWVGECGGVNCFPLCIEVEGWGGSGWGTKCTLWSHPTSVSYFFQPGPIP